MPRLPLASIDEVRAELDDVLVSLDRLASTRPVSPEHVERREERRQILVRWRDDLAAQLAEMTAGGEAA